MKALEKDRSADTRRPTICDGCRRYLQANWPWASAESLVSAAKASAQEPVVFAAGCGRRRIAHRAVTTTMVYLQERAPRGGRRRAAGGGFARAVEIAGRVAQAKGSWPDISVPADKLLDGITLENPSAEAAAMLRSWEIGRRKRRWQQAAARIKQFGACGSRVKSQRRDG